MSTVKTPPCCPRGKTNHRLEEATLPQKTPEPKLESLIPIAVVIAAGCVPCAHRMIERALQEGSSRKHIMKTVAIVEHMRRQDCLREAVGADTVARMGAPLDTARKTLASAHLPGTGRDVLSSRLA